MKVVFADFDGVLVCLPPERDRLATTGNLVRAANRDCVARLNEIVRRTCAVVVVSSTWRKHHTLEMLRATLERAGFVGEVVDVTPVIMHETGETQADGWKSEREAPRGEEIAEWIKHGPPRPMLDSYVVLDDDLDPGPLPLDRWVHVDHGWFDGGLQDEHVERAVRVLGEK